MEKREYLERKDFKSLQAYEAYILACVEESIKRSNESIQKTNKIIEETNRILLNKARKITWNGYKEMTRMEKIYLTTQCDLN